MSSNLPTKPRDSGVATPPKKTLVRRFGKYFVAAGGEELIGPYFIAAGKLIVSALGTVLLAILAYDSGLQWYWLVLFAALTFYAVAGGLNKLHEIVTRFRSGEQKSPDAHPGLPSRLAQGDSVRADLNEKLLEAYRRFDGIIEYQRTGLRKYVLVERCEINSSPLSKGKLYVEFTFHVFNYSMFSVSIPAAVGTQIVNSIKFRGDLLSGLAKLVENRVVELLPYHGDYFRVRQGVDAREAADILEMLKTTGNLFDFSETIIPIGGGEKSPDAEAAELDLARGMRNAELENKAVQLENELAAWQRHSVTIEHLSLALGGAYVLHRLFRAGEPPSKERVVLWLDSTLHGHFHKEFLEAYFEGMPVLTDSPAEQEEWVDWHCFRLRRFIAEEYRKIQVARSEEKQRR